MDDLLGVVVRIGVLYLYVLALLRISGKRTLGELSPHDFVVALMVGDLFDDIIWADVPLAKGLVAAAVLIALDVLLGVLEKHSRGLHHLLSSTPTPVVKAGQWLPEGLRALRENQGEVRQSLRQHAVRDLHEVALAQYEPDGGLSVQREERFQPARRAELPAVRRWLEQNRRAK